LRATAAEACASPCTPRPRRRLPDQPRARPRPRYEL